MVRGGVSGESAVSLQTLSIASTTFIVLSGVGLLAGWWAIRRGDVARHRTAMGMATVLAALFLVTYVTRWSLYGSRPFEGTGVWRAVYLATLVPHIVLATALAPLVARQLYLALVRRDFEAHRRLGRRVVPLWLFVAASGWVVYWMLYHF